jgi:hypothetical protein
MTSFISILLIQTISVVWICFEFSWHSFVFHKNLSRGFAPSYFSLPLSLNLLHFGKVQSPVEPGTADLSSHFSVVRNRRQDSNQSSSSLPAPPLPSSSFFFSLSSSSSSSVLPLSFFCLFGCHAQQAIF